MLDVHTHFIADLEPPDDRALEQGWPVVRHVSDEAGLRAEVLQRGTVVRMMPPGAWDASARLSEMDRLGVEEHVVSPTPFTFLYDADPDVGDAYARAQNDALVELVGKGNGRLFGLGALPLADPAAAVAEAERIATLPGLHGVEIGTSAGTRELHDEELDPVFEVLERLGLGVFVHPGRLLAPARTAHHGLGFGLGRPVETELAVGSLVFGGVLDRHPDLRVCLSHGGAGIPAIRGRLANGWRRQAPAGRHPVDDPLVALHRLWADGLTYDAGALALAEDTFGAERLVLGTDYPFAAQEGEPGASFRAGEDRLRLGAQWPQRTQVNGRAFLGLDHDMH